MWNLRQSISMSRKVLPTTQRILRFHFKLKCSTLEGPWICLRGNLRLLWRGNIFSLSLQRVFFSNSATTRYFRITLYLNGNNIGSTEVEEANTSLSHTPSLQSTLDLQAGDQVWVQISYQSAGVYLYDDGRHFTHFTGWILEQDNFPSL
jgi:hypothetical protein